MIATFRNKLSHAFAYFAVSLGTGSLADTDRFPTEMHTCIGTSETRWPCRSCAAEWDEPMTTLWEWEDEQRKLRKPE